MEFTNVDEQQQARSVEWVASYERVSADYSEVSAEFVPQTTQNHPAPSTPNPQRVKYPTYKSRGGAAR